MIGHLSPRQNCKFIHIATQTKTIPPQQGGAWPVVDYKLAWCKICGRLRREYPDRFDYLTADGNNLRVQSTLKKRK